MDTFLESTWIPVVEAIVKTIVIPLIIYAGLWVRKWVDVQAQKLATEMELAERGKINEYIYLLQEIINTAVLSVESTYVEALKEEGSWTVESQKEAFEVAKQKVLDQLTHDGRRMLEKGLEDYQTYIEDKIEALVRTL